MKMIRSDARTFSNAIFNSVKFKVNFVPFCTMKEYPTVTQPLHIGPQTALAAHALVVVVTVVVVEVIVVASVTTGAMVVSAGQTPQDPLKGILRYSVLKFEPPVVLQ